MMDDIYIYVITALLPLSACMVVVQKNPYHALVIRGILGAIAAMVYAVLGAADVALTEALVGTMLAITLYAVAVRSSMNMRLGVLKQDLPALEGASLPNGGDPGKTVVLSDHALSPGALMGHLRTLLKNHYMRLELVPYADLPALQEALVERDVHAICLPPEIYLEHGANPEVPSYSIATRVRRLYDLMQAELPLLAAGLHHIDLTEQPLLPIKMANPDLSTPEEVTS